MLAEFPREELAAGLDAVVAEILALAGVERPPVDAFAVARALDITVAADDCQDGRARYVRRKGRSRPAATILLKADPRAERRQWAVAHEIGEHATQRAFAVWGVDPRETPPNAREAVASHLAGRLLLPTAWFAADAAECGWDLLALKTRYASASHELIARRMLECRPPVIITIFDQRAMHFRRSNLPGRIPPPSPAELACWRAVHHGNRAQTAAEGPCTVQGWPVHEDGWQREILRTEIDEYGLEG
jgi:hypothetical protein